MGGLVNAITARPTGDNSGFARMEYGNFASSRLQTAVNLPLTDSISARVAYGSYSKDGTTMNEYTGNEVDGRDEWGARISVDFDLGDIGVLQLTSDIREIDDNRLNIAGQYCAADPFYGCSPFEQGPFGGIYHLAGTIGGGLGKSLSFLQVQMVMIHMLGLLDMMTLTEFMKVLIRLENKIFKIHNLNILEILTLEQLR